MLFKGNFMIFKLIITDYQIIVTVLIVLAAWKWGDWKHWKLYYPTMLFFALGDFAAHLVTFNYPLWSYESPLLKKTFSDLLIASVFFPATILLYLTHFPKKPLSKTIYVIIWAVSYTLVEELAGLLGFFSHDNGWSIWWTLLFNSLMFPIFRIHFKKPLLALFVSFILAVALMLYFKVPWSAVS
jgi:hypothetical protein